MRIFTASLATETNTFSPMYTDLVSFYQSFYAPPGQHPVTPTLCSAPLVACREYAQQHSAVEVIEGTCAWAEPGGLLNRLSYEHLRDEILMQLEAAMPVQLVVLGLHGAMVAQGYDDCEGDFLSRVRAIVGPQAVIGATLDPHSHLTDLRLASADLLIAFKEFPHLDFMARARELVYLAVAAARGDIKPVMSCFDCRMIDVLPTNHEPMKSFIEKICQLEQDHYALSISVIHGFMAGDVPDMGSKLLVITNNDATQGEALARQLGLELFSYRGQTLPQFYDIATALDQAEQLQGTLVLADVWDNPGGGVAGDGTLILHQMIKRQLQQVAVGTIWDPMAVKLCFAAGEGAEIELRFGGKSCANAGAPIDKTVRVLRLKADAQQEFADSLVPMGDCALISFDGIEVILNSNRCQSFDPSLFRALGIEPSHYKLLLIKSTNHFYQGFAPLASHIIYVDAGAPYPSDPTRNAYKKLSRPVWPVVAAPFD
ncbi:M81 family metallopeptidase [Rheinheimera soli]|uniref:Microcystinase C n=1 Tax=Rheinheimera soli TaxID=443616 RepID=A0ABU1W129_9GAMM|nr:M81 family metallopeptidase [Rheinheimera soli]MDR7121403.1 microcystin degradation protein MlrC [Rheinheimera soli]